MKLHLISMTLNIKSKMYTKSHFKFAYFNDSSFLSK